MHKPNSIFEAASQVLKDAYVNKGIMYDGKGVKVGKTYQMRHVISRNQSTDFDVIVLKIDRNIVIYKKVAGAMQYQPERMPIEEFEAKLFTS